MTQRVNSWGEKRIGQSCGRNRVHDRNEPRTVLTQRSDIARSLRLPRLLLGCH